MKRLIALALALTTASCGPEEDLYLCVKPELRPGAEVNASSPGQEQPLYLNSEVIWRGPEIPVCWDSDTYEIHSEDDREIVRRAVTASWETALAFDLVDPRRWVHFTGWRKCDSTTQKGIHIAVPVTPDVRPNSQLGTRLDGVHGGMVLNFTFKEWGEHCGSSESHRKRCIHSIAVHEFGHALGFSHEQNRPDTASELCADQAQGSNGDVLLGAWDIESVLNYCNPEYNNGGELSLTDTLGVRATYYPDLYDPECVRTFQAP